MSVTDGLEKTLNILILGASYGMLPGVKLALAGHEVTFVGKAEEIAALQKHDLLLRIPMRKSAEQFELRCSDAKFVTPEQAVPAHFDFVVLAMQEPQFAASDIVALAQRVAASDKPCLSIMNLPPPAFLKRLGIDEAAFEGVYSGRAAWENFNPARMSNASPDPQALRMSPERPGELTVTLASNFKAAPFPADKDQAMLEDLARHMSRLKVKFAGKHMAPPVCLLAHSSKYIPLAKWPMLIAGNSRCLTDDGICTIAEAVWTDLHKSRAIYEQVQALVIALGAPEAVLVPFDHYAEAAKQLTRPSSAARAIANGASRVERIDRLVLNLMQQHGLECADVEKVSARMASRLGKAL